LGRLYITPAAAAALPHKEVLHALARHASGDWGTVVGEDGQANERALQAGGGLLSADPKTRLLVIPPPTGIYHKREECWYRQPASLFAAPELCSLIDFVHAGGSLLAFAHRFGDAFTPTNLGLLAPAFGCLLNDDAILDLRQLKAPHPLATHFDTTVDELPGVWVVAGIRTLRWRCMATCSILPGARAWPLLLSPALGSVSYHARLRQISYQSLPLGVAGTLGKGRFAFFGGPHAFETTPLGLLERAHNARFLRHVLAWLLTEPGPDRGNTPPPAFGKPPQHGRLALAPVPARRVRATGRRVRGVRREAPQRGRNPQSPPHREVVGLTGRRHDA